MSGQPLLVTVFSDASHEPGKAGCGWWFKSQHITLAGHGQIEKEGIGTHEAELWGIHTALLQCCTAHAAQGVQIMDVVLQCDSLPALSALHTKGYRWVKTSAMKAGRRQRLTPFEQSLIDQIKNMKMLNQIWLKHVKGHTKNDDARSYVNNLTDRLAGQARKQNNGPA